jgi:MFS family permease
MVHARPTSASFSGTAATFTGWLSLAQLVGWGSTFYTFSMLMVPVEQALGLSRSEVSWAFSGALIAEGAAAFAVGRWIDQGHARRVMSGGSVLAVLSLLGLSACHTVWGWTLGWLGLGVAMAATLYTPAFAVLTLRHPNNFRRHIISLTFLGGLASTVFIPLMAWLIDAVGWRAMLWVLAACQGLICLPVHAWVLRGIQGPPQATVPHHHRHPGHDTYRHAMRQPTFVLVGVFVVLTLSTSVAVAAHLVNLLAESGLPPAWAVWLPACVGVVQVAGRSGLFFWEHRASVHSVNRWIPLLMPAGLLALLGALAALQTAPVWALAGTVVFVTLYGLGNGMGTIVKGTAVAQYVSQTHAASLNGVLGVPTAIGRAAAPTLLAALWSPARGYTLGLWALWVSSLVAWLALLAAQRLHARQAMR